MPETHYKEQELRNPLRIVEYFEAGLKIKRVNVITEHGKNKPWCPEDIELWYPVTISKPQGPVVGVLGGIN